MFDALSQLVEEPNERVTAAEVDRFQDSYGFQLPQEYREFILEVNGGRPARGFSHVFVEGSSEPLCTLQTFLGIISSGATYKDIAETVRTGSDFLPTGQVPIAMDDFGNFVLLDCRPEARNNKVYYCTVVSVDGHMHLADRLAIADSFTSFLELLGRYNLPGDPAWLEAIVTNDAAAVIEMLENGLSPHVVYQGYSITEYAAIHAQDELLGKLVALGAEVGNALNLARQNAQFFSKHQSTVEFLEKAIDYKGKERV